MQTHTIDTRWVKIHSVEKILVFSIFHITSHFLCVTLRLRASALKSTAVFRVNPVVGCKWVENNTNNCVN